MHRVQGNFHSFKKAVDILSKFAVFNKLKSNQKNGMWYDKYINFSNSKFREDEQFYV